MSADAIWQAFAETGDPLYYLLYKATGDNTNKKQSAPKKRRGDNNPPAQG